ncbi:MAG: hypothetical protein FWF30_02545, partial [Coriobacteriia bacterium]|nr:hypothetical protein [Coriobacteriia bacterium]
DALAALGPAAAPSLLRLKNESADNVVAADAQSRLNALADERNGANARPWYAFSLNELKVWGVGTGK